MCLSAPKYGNDDDYADEVAKDLFKFIIGEESKYRGSTAAGCSV